MLNQFPNPGHDSFSSSHSHGHYGRHDRRQAPRSRKLDLKDVDWYAGMGVTASA
jgi:hypothetical protein